jgi:hypothetical protein
MAKISYQNAVVRTYPEDKIPDTWAREMGVWMGKEVTLRVTSSGRYIIEEDPKWSWEYNNFILLDGGQQNPNFLFKHKKIKNGKS